MNVDWSQKKFIRKARTLPHCYFPIRGSLSTSRVFLFLLEENELFFSITSCIWPIRSCGFNHFPEILGRRIGKEQSERKISDRRRWCQIVSDRFNKFSLKWKRQRNTKKEKEQTKNETKNRIGCESNIWSLIGQKIFKQMENYHLAKPVMNKWKVQ